MMKTTISDGAKSACQQPENTPIAGGRASMTDGAKGPPSLQELHNDNEHDLNKSTGMIVNASMLYFFLFSATALGWVDIHLFSITAVAFLYSTVMIHLLLRERHNEAKRKLELQACVWIRTAKWPEVVHVFN
jgi:Flp pilus assembly protein TadB